MTRQPERGESPAPRISEPSFGASLSSPSSTPWAFAATFLNSAVILLCGLLTGIVTARVLGAEGRGLLAALLFWPQFAAALATLSIADAMLVRWQETAEKVLLVRAGYRLAGFALLAVLPLGAIYAATIPIGDIAALWPLALLLWALQCGVVCYDQVAQGLLRGHQHFAMFNVLRASMPLGYLLLSAALLLWSPSLEAFLLGYLLALVVTFALRLRVIRRFPEARRDALAGTEPLRLWPTALRL
ncbi:MAG: oligosaccharide flippase family protein, partial [Pseudomonadota bacterium]